TGFAVGQLREFVLLLREIGWFNAAAAAARAVDAVDAIDRGTRGLDALLDELDGLDPAVRDLPDSDAAMLFQTFDQRALRAGLVLATRHGPDPGLLRLLRDDPRIRRALSVEDAAALAAALSR